MATVATAATGDRGSVSVDVAEAKFFQKRYSVRVTSPLLRSAYFEHFTAASMTPAENDDEHVRKSQMVS